MSGGLSVTTEFTPHKRSKGHWMQMDISRYFKKIVKQYDNGYLFIQDKVRCNISKKASKWLDDHYIDYFKDWPTKGIDMNVIENVWGTLEQEKRAKDFSKVDPMKKFIISKMKKIAIMAVRRYIDSMPLRLQEVIDKNGSYTKYF